MFLAHLLIWGVLLGLSAVAYAYGWYVQRQRLKVIKISFAHYIAKVIDPG